MRTQLQPKKTKVSLYILAFTMAAKELYALYTTNKTEHFSFKRGCVIQVAKWFKEDWLVVLQY